MQAGARLYRTLPVEGEFLQDGGRLGTDFAPVRLGSHRSEVKFAICPRTKHHLLSVAQSAQMSSKKWVKKRESSFVLLGITWIVCKSRCAVTKNGVKLAMEQGSTTAFMCRCNTAAVMKYRTFMFGCCQNCISNRVLSNRRN
jgi:hypothetical protein